MGGCCGSDGGSRWTEVTASKFPHEREALAYLRERLPDREPFRVWSNFTFIGNDGRLSEVDALVVSPTGVLPSNRLGSEAGSAELRHPRRLRALCHGWHRLDE
ncbi:MAG: nuclease-related domain-containing protein [Egibacteraceae bacterium]